MATILPETFPVGPSGELAALTRPALHGMQIVVGAVVALNLAAPVINIPRERYIVDLDVAPPDLLYETLAAPPLMAIERPYTLDEIRYNVELRDRMRRIDINTITFDTGSWTVTPDQYDRLAGMADAIQRLLRRRPDVRSWHALLEAARRDHAAAV